MSKFSNLKRKEGRSVIIDFPYEDEEVKIQLRVPPVGKDLLIAVKSREYAISQGIENPTEKDDVYKLRNMAEVVFRITYECVKDSEGVWKATDTLFFDSVEEIIANVDQDLLLFIHEYYQNFRSISRKDEAFTPENVAVITSVLGGEGSEEDKANFYCLLPPRIRYSYTRFTAKLLVNSQPMKFTDSSKSSEEPVINSPD